MSNVVNVNAIRDYLATTKPENIHSGFLGYLANLTEVAKVVPAVAKSIVQELKDRVLFRRISLSFVMKISNCERNGLPCKKQNAANKAADKDLLHVY